jgi:hypothetical protein
MQSFYYEFATAYEYCVSGLLDFESLCTALLHLSLFVLTYHIYVCNIGYELINLLQVASVDER